MSRNIKERVEQLQHYWITYTNQPSYEHYTDKTFLDDALYGIGIAISDDFKCAGGYDKFKELLISHLTNSSLQKQEG